MSKRHYLVGVALAFLLVPQSAHAQTFFTARLTAAQETHDVTSEATGTAALAMTAEGVRFEGLRSDDIFTLFPDIVMQPQKLGLDPGFATILFALLVALIGVALSILLAFAERPRVPSPRRFPWRTKGARGDRRGPWSRRRPG